MKKYIFRSIAAAGLIAALTGCDENYWNDHELDGFEDKVPETTDKNTVEYTLTDADYKAIADNSTNKTLAKEAGLSKELAAVGTQHYFAGGIDPQTYLPAFFASNSFSYYTLSDGSAIQLTYKTANSASAEAAAKAASASMYTVSDEEYREVWESSDDWAQSFTPSHTATKALPSILDNAYPDAEEGDFVVVTYNTSDSEPVFSKPDEPDQPGFVLSQVLGTAAVGDDVTVNGYVSALSTNGCILNDASGSIFVYNPTGLADLKIGDQIVLSGTIGEYNKGLQVAAGSTFEVAGTQKVTYPTPTVFDGAALDQVITRTASEGPIYCSVTGTVKVNGNNINIILDGAEKAQASAYYSPADLKEKLTDGSTVTLEGYLIAIAGGRYCSIVATDVKTPSKAARADSESKPTFVASQKVSAVYSYNNGKWSAATGYTALSHADYQAMGQKYDNLSGETPDQYLPLYINKNYPYAQQGEEKYVVYFYYSGSTSVRCMPFIFNGSEWTVNDGIETETAQYVRANGKWMYDPNIEITLPAGKNQELSTLYFQACVDWVKDNVPDGAKYVTSYGNNEYYTGSSAYQGNVDLRADKAIAQYPEGYANMSEAEVVEAMKKHFALEVFPAVLAQLNPDVAPLEGFDVLFTVNFSTYDGSTTTAQKIVYKVVEKGKYEFVSCTWDEEK